MDQNDSEMACFPAKKNIKENLLIAAMRFQLAFGPGVSIGTAVLSGGQKFYPVLIRPFWFAKAKPWDYFNTMEQATKAAERIQVAKHYKGMKVGQ